MTIKYTEQLLIKLTKAQKDRLAKLALEQDRGVSNVARQIISQYLEQHPE